MGWKKDTRDYLEAQGDWHFPTFTPGGRMGGKRQDMRRWLTVPIKWVFRGDRHAAFAFMRQAEAMMGMLEQQMAFLNVRQGVLRRLVRPDVHIECDKRFGLRTITITVARITGGEVGKEEDMFRLLVAVSNSTGIHLYGAKQWKRNFIYETPMYGYYEAIPDSYHFERLYRGSYNTWTFPATNTVPLARAVDTSLTADGMDSLISDTEKIWFVEEKDLVVYGWYGLSRYTVNSSPTGCKWCRPVLMPENDKRIFSAFVTRYGGENVDPDDLPAEYRYYDALLLSDIGLGKYDEQGKNHGRSISCRRGNSAGTYGDVGPIVPLPEHNGVRRYVILRWGGEVFRESVVDPVLFRLTSFRGENDVRDIAFKAGMLAEHCPEWLRNYLYANGPNKNYFHVMGSWANAHDTTGVLTVHLVLFFGTTDGYFEYGDYEYEDPALLERIDRRQWGMVMCRFVVPAAVPEMDRTEEESSVLRDTEIHVTTCEQFLPLLDMLIWENRGKLYKDGMGGADFDSFVSDEPEFLGYPPHVLYAEELDRTSGKRFVNYTVGETTYDAPGNVPYDLMNGEIHIIWDHAFSMGMALFARQDIDDQKVLFARGDTAYSWTRHFGGVALTPLGMVPQVMVWPEVVGRDVRARPDVTYAGGDLWCCVCEHVGEQVLSVHVGAPVPTGEREPGWTDVTLVTDEWAAREGNRIVYVRPLRATEERVVLLAIVRTTSDGQALYRLAVCDGAPGNPDSTMLKLYGVIPVECDDAGMSWDVCVLDSTHEYAQMAISYPTPPTADCAGSYSKSDMLYRVPIQSLGI